MAIFKCKMCGGALEIQNSETVFVCEYCGTQQTLPKLDDERRANLYDRANHFRRNNEFDKAIEIYEQILNEDNTDAEAYWSLVLCCYGIEYVEDPSSHKRIPTVNRAQYTSIFDDDNYKSAVNNADTYQKAIYEKEAKAINEIQKEILAISQKEDPFDVFICYKETDNNGRRTLDSVLANDLYHQLTQEGFKVFFARITLEDKLGSAYEPYIFAALNSAKVMVVLGTNPEYFNAAWVKNEWQRYLSLIKNGAKKMLVPAYKDMDPYDLPKEFSHLQAQDMSKLGFMQDLIRGIKKIIDAQAPKTTVVKETVVFGGNTNTAPLLKRAFMFLEDKEWDSANEYCEKILDIDPECAEAYLGKLMGELNITSRQNLKNCSTPFDGKNNYQKAMRFADENLKKELQGYINFIANRNLADTYNEAVCAMKTATSEGAYKEASVKLEELCDYKDSKELAKECREKAENLRKEAVYNSAVSFMNKGTIQTYKKAIELFKTIEEWKDSYSKICDCERHIYEVEQKEEADRKEAARLAEEKRIANAKAAKKRKTIIAITTPILCVCIAFTVLLNTVIVPNCKYEKAISLMNSAKYGEAIATFEELEGYKDSEAKIDETRYLMAKSYIDNKDYDNANKQLLVLSNSKEFAAKIDELRYMMAESYLENKDYDNAIEYFLVLSNYKDSAEKIDEARYLMAKSYLDSKDYDNAIKQFLALSNYKDSADLISSTIKAVLQKAVLQPEKINVLSTVPDDIYKTDVSNCYDYALILFNSKDYSLAKHYFDLCKGYKDANKYSAYCGTMGRPAVGTTELFCVNQVERGEILFFTGEMDGNYLGTSTDPKKGVYVTLEEVKGGFRLSFVKNGKKQYIDIYEYVEGKAGVRLTTEPTATFVWNAECGVFTAEVAGAPRYLGTYGTYNTISASDIKYIAGENVAKIGVSQFPAGFGTATPVM